LFDSSTPLLKAVPTAYSLGFLVLSAIVARRLFGDVPALITAAYLALPPSMWAVWSTKARGGYAEVLFLGEALLLVTLTIDGAFMPLLWGVLAGLALWTHLLAVVYVVPCVVYLAARRRRWKPSQLGLAAAGCLLGAAPLLLYNIRAGFPTLAALLQPADLPLDPLAQLLRFFRVGVPVLAGLGQPTTSADLFDQDWLMRPAGHLSVTLVLLALLGAAVALQWPAVKALFGPRRDDGQKELLLGTGAKPGPALLVLLALSVPPVVALTRFGFFVSEPRYALPLYSTVPLVAAAIWRLPRLVSLGAVAALLAFNLWSLASTDLRLWRPEEAISSTPATRAALVGQLTGEDRHQMYTDYWIAYPVMFETHETVLAYVISGGFNRYIPPADNVQRTPNAVWVFMAGSDADHEFEARLRAAGASALVRDVAVYRVYADVSAMEALRPQR
jgi:hypothetical protein